MKPNELSANGFLVLRLRKLTPMEQWQPLEWNQHRPPVHFRFPYAFGSPPALGHRSGLNKLRTNANVIE